MSSAQAQPGQRHRPRPLAGGARRLDALVLDADQRQSLVCVRSLGRAGVRVGAFARQKAPAFSSRWCAVSGIVPDVADDPGAFVDAVVGRAQRHCAGVAICTHDGSLEALRRRRVEVERHVTLPLASERALGIAVSKERTLSLAAELGIPTPRSVVIRDAADVRAAAEELGFPLVVKPSASWVERDGLRMRLICALAIDLDETRAAVEAIDIAGGTAILQEWLTGTREAVSLLRTEGRVAARFAQVAHRMHPPLGGSSVARESIPLPPDITSFAEALAEASDLDGYCEIEFRRDAAGQAKLMEINPRLSASVEIAVRAGVDFPLLIYRSAAGEQLCPVGAYRTGLRMRWLGGDLHALHEMLANHGRPDSAAPWRAIGSFVGDFLRPTYYDYVARDDPRPAIAATASWLRRRATVAKKSPVLVSPRRET